MASAVLARPPVGVADANIPTATTVKRPKLMVKELGNLDDDAPTFFADRDPLFTSESVDHWTQPETHSDFNGLVVPRPLNGIWDVHQSAIDAALSRIGNGLAAEVDLHSKTLAADLEAAVRNVLTDAALPAPLSEQIQSDALSVGAATAAMCADTARAIEVKLEIFGESICKRWHMDNIVGRAIVCYTGTKGTDFTRNSNVNFWELQHCGNNDCIILDQTKVESVSVGDLLFCKGSGYKGAKPLVHKSPAPTYNADGTVLNRLLLKVDVVGCDCC